ncbi:glucose-6-phosphate isomerase [Alicyclobacillus sp. SO9]|uniref:glucose-6-phosphate isomerase n=1 Tax=Alicyclobacillus sp. SO9 TaxID=2665646 RepID=UPI0018E78A52|nr:glucose-6-phosphate isomerase [Alicyclobacillus sp. SO9]QQE77776.1 glucose-6-phosphate isomerase [Alicyclobacillus sp. SO9]
MVTLDLSFAHLELHDDEWIQLQPYINTAHQQLHKKETPGSDFLGWLHLPSQTLDRGLDNLLEVAAEVREHADALVVVGIGGSYLGARAAFEWVQPPYYNQLSREKRGGPEIYFAGNQLSGQAMEDLLQVLEGKRVYLNVISKSGTTTEPAVAFRVLRNWLVRQSGEDAAKKQILATTDKSKGALRTLADEEGYKTFVIPDDVGGRYSVLTPVGLLPLASAGVDIRMLLQGAREAEEKYARSDLTENPAYRYAAVRNALYRKGKTAEILAYYEPSFQMFAEWWKQLYGESEGKDNKGIFPVSVGYTTDLHSLGQYIQEGVRNLFETVLTVDYNGDEIQIPSQPDSEDGLEYLADKTLSWVNNKARVATQLAHADGGVPNLLISIPDKTEKSLGHLFYFFELACAASGLLLGVNPFNQPGVEAYKVNMFALLGKPGFEEQSQAIRERLNSLR